MSTEDEFTAIAQAIADSPKKKDTAVALPSSSLRYSPSLMVDIIINNPDYSPKQLGEVFGRPQSWVSQVLASASFQAALDPHRHEVLNPEYAMTLEERFRALTIRSLSVLQEKLEAGKLLPDSTVLGIATLGIKALGMGQKEIEKQPSESAKNSSEMVADRIMAAMQRRKEVENSSAIDVDVKEVSDE